MSVPYRKWGRVVRWENGVLLRVSEAGEAIERGPSFECRPLGEEEPLTLDASAPSPGLQPPSPKGRGVVVSASPSPSGRRWRVAPDEAPAILGADVLSTARAIGELPHVERAIVSDGIAEHEYGGVRWTERARRVHLSIAARGVRALVDGAGFDLSEAARIAGAIARGVRPSARPPRLRLAPSVTAALLRDLVGVIDVEQAAADHDGKGRPIAPLALAEGLQWPNWFRPSYRVRPLRMPFHLRALPFGTVDRGAPEAIALVGPRRVLLEDGGLVDVELREVRAVGQAGRWYPYGAGSFGAELML